MTTITLTSNYNKRTLSIRVSDSIAAKLRVNDEKGSLAVINAELDRVAVRDAPLYLSAGQCRRIASYLKGCGDYRTEATAKQGRLSADEVTHLIYASGGFANWRGWTRQEIAEWVRSNYYCSASVAKRVAYAI